MEGPLNNWGTDGYSPCMSLRLRICARFWDGSVAQSDMEDSHPVGDPVSIVHNSGWLC